MSRKAPVVQSIMDESRMEKFEDHWEGARDSIVAIQHFVLGRTAPLLRDMGYLAQESSPEFQSGLRKAIGQMRRDGSGTTETSRMRRIILAKTLRRAKDEMREATHALWQADNDIDPPEIPRHMRTVVLLDEHIHDLAAIADRLLGAHGKDKTTRLIWGMRTQDKVREIQRILDRLRQSPSRTATRREHGWSASELRNRAGLSATRFVTLCKDCADIERPASGHHEFRFCRRDVSRLVEKARTLGTPKLIVAANRWSAMLADSAA